MGCAPSKMEYAVTLSVYSYVPDAAKVDDSKGGMLGAAAGMLNKATEAASKAADTVASATGAMIYHSGFVIDGLEYGFAKGPGGVYTCTPKELPDTIKGMTFKESIDRGSVTLKKGSIPMEMTKMKATWDLKKEDYDMVKFNGNDFVEALCQSYGVEGLPSYVNKAAITAEKGVDSVKEAKDKAMGAVGGLMGKK